VWMAYEDDTDDCAKDHFPKEASVSLPSDPVLEVCKFLHFEFILSLFFR
jgi:hypothetical protein